MLLDLRLDQLQIVQTILQKHVPQYDVWAFGSRAKWTAKDYSDLDLCIFSDQPLSFKILGALNEDFAESDLPWKVDVVDWATTSESFRKIIERDKVVVQMQNKENCVLSRVSTNEWSQLTLGDLCERGDALIQTGPFGSQLHASDYVSDGVPVVPTEAIGRRRIKTNAVPHVSNETATRLAKHKLKVGDILFARRGAQATGLSALVEKRHEGWLCSTGAILLRTSPERIDPRFLAFYLSQDSTIAWLKTNAVGAVMPNLNDGVLRRLPVVLPEKSEQTAIAEVLCQLDDKLEITQRQQTLLDAMAQALFQSWFVDFDPVRAKAEDRLPFGLDTATAALFPGKFVDSDLGEIPAGWSATTLADIVTERTGKVGPGNGHVILSTVASGELKHSDEHFTKQVYSQDTSKYKRVEQWDYAYNPSRINIGSIGMLEEPIVGAVSPVYTVLRPAQGYEWFLRFFLDLPQTKAVINQFCSGSVRQSLSFKDFAAIPMVLPPKEIAEAFSRRWQELNALRQQLDAQSRQLAEVRDTLLPKLMSGELRVPESLMA